MNSALMPCEERPVKEVCKQRHRDRTLNHSLFCSDEGVVVRPVLEEIKEEEERRKETQNTRRRGGGGGERRHRTLEEEEEEEEKGDTEH